jgi:hypothetical protein
MEREGAAPWQLGTRIAKRYDLKRHLGSGAMGEVYLAFDRRLKKDVALKVLNVEVAKTRAVVQRFCREVALAHFVTHPNVVRIYDTGEAAAPAAPGQPRPDPLPYFTMEYLRGQTLEEALAVSEQSHSPMTVPEVIDILSDILDGLRAAHHEGVIHRDLKPSNVMLTHRGAILLDFGVAGHPDDRWSRDVVDPRSSPRSLVRTEAGTIFGSPAYMAPELWQHAPASAQADLYAVGVIAYQMLAGRLPFDGEHFAQYVEAARTQNPKPLRHFRKDVSLALQRFVARLMARKPEDRFASALVARRHLLRLHRWRTRASVMALGLLGTCAAYFSAPLFADHQPGELGLRDEVAATDLKSAVRAYDLGDLAAASFGLQRLHSLHPESAAIAFWRATLAQETGDVLQRRHACSDAELWKGNDDWIALARAACGPSYEASAELLAAARGQRNDLDRSLIALAVLYDLAPKLEATDAEVPHSRELFDALKRSLEQVPDWSQAEFTLPTRWQLAHVHLDLARGDTSAAALRLARVREGPFSAPSANALSARLDLYAVGADRANLWARSNMSSDPRPAAEVMLHRGELKRAMQFIEQYTAHPTFAAMIDMWCGYAFRYGVHKVPAACTQVQPGLTRALWGNQIASPNLDEDLRAMRPTERDIWHLQQSFTRHDAAPPSTGRVSLTLAPPPYTTYRRTLEILTRIEGQVPAQDVAVARRQMSELSASAQADPWTQLVEASLAHSAGASAYHQRALANAAKIWQDADPDLPLITRLTRAMAPLSSPVAEPAEPEMYAIPDHHVQVSNERIEANAATSGTRRRGESAPKIAESHAVPSLPAAPIAPTEDLAAFDNAWLEEGPL